MRPVAGAGNYAIDEIKSLPVLLTMGLSMLDKEVSQEFFKSLSELGWKDLEKIFISKIEEYNDPDRVYYTASYDGVSLIVGIVTGIYGAKKLLTEVRRLLKKIKKNTEIDWDLIKQNNPDLDVEEFSKEISNIDSDDLLDAFKEKPELVKAYEAVSKHPNISKHIPSLEKVSDLLNDADFMGKLPNGRADLDGIIDAVKNPLDEGTASKLVKLTDHLENVKQVVKKHSGAEGFDKLMTDLKNPAFAMQDGVTHMLNDVKNFASGKVKKFDYEFDGDGVVCTKCRFDVELSSGTPRLIEYKSWSLENIPNISSKQLTEYFRSATSIGDIKYVFNKLKTPDVNSVKTQMKSVLSDNMEDIFEAMPSNFRENLLGAGKGDRLDLFEGLIDDTSSKLYDFIEVK